MVVILHTKLKCRNMQQIRHEKKHIWQFWNTLKSLYNGHHRDPKIVSVIGLFCTATYSNVLGHSSIDHKVCQEADIGGRENLKAVVCSKSHCKEDVLGHV